MTATSFDQDFTRDIARGVTSRFLRDLAPPHAVWVRPEEIRQAPVLNYDPENPGAKILVGALGSKLIGIEDNRHILTVAGSRAGKSVTLISNLLFYRGSVLAMDPKAELAEVTAERRAQLGQRVYVLDPFHHADERIAKFRARYNPLAVLAPTSPTIIEDAGLIADALVIVEGKDPHWDESARSFIVGLILHVATDPFFEGRRTLVSVRDALNLALMAIDAEPGGFAVFEQMLDNAARLGQAAETEDLARALEGAARSFYEKGENERAGVLSTARRHTAFLDSSGMRRVLSGHDFDLGDLKRDPRGVTVYLCLPASRLSLCNRWMRIFVNQLLDAMERERRVPQAPVIVALDEFPILGFMSQLQDAAGLIASFHVKLWVMLQDWNQGKALYKERWETFAGNAGILQFFGNNDLATTEYVSKRLGRTRVAVPRKSEVTSEQRQKGLTGETEQIELYPLLTPEEVARQFARNDRLKRQLILWASSGGPMMLQRVAYYDVSAPWHRAFHGKYAARA